VSRIRSLHPGIFTDERYMALSFPARELLKGIWCEADDQGAFEWKPLTLKARIMPADAVNVAELLDELKAGQFVAQYEHEGRSYGVVRNFRRFQRPQKPHALHPLPPELRNYVGLSEETTELSRVGREPLPDQSHADPISVPDQSDTDPASIGDGYDTGTVPVAYRSETGTVKCSQMEDEGCRRKESINIPTNRACARARDAPAAQSYAFAGTVIRLTQADFDRWRSSFHAIADLRAELATIDAKLVDEGYRGKWFGRTSAWLQAKHERLLREATAEDELYRGVL